MKSNGILDTSSLTQSELHLLQTITDSLGASIFTKDLNGCYTFVNRAFCEMVGASWEHVVGRPLDDLFDPTTAIQLRADDLRVLATGQTVEQKEYRVAKAGGEQHAYLTVKRPIYGPQGGRVRNFV